MGFIDYFYNNRHKAYYFFCLKKRTIRKEVFIRDTSIIMQYYLGSIVRFLMSKGETIVRNKSTPLYDALAKFAKKRPVSLHVPGHKNGLYFPSEGMQHFHSILEIDATELSGLDDLHSPSGCIEEAQQLLAELYGSSASYFLINGSTVGNLAMILAVCKEDDIVLVQRNCHKSIIHGLELAGAIPVFLAAEIDQTSYVPSGIAYETVRAALEQYPRAKAVILTHPNYYGQATDLTAIIELAHNMDIPVLVDEAHGAHFCLGKPFPKSALEYGADLVVHSAHKTLPAMTMGSYLHFNSRLVDQEEVSRYISMLQSSSPSYPIMASLDLARFSLACWKESGTEELQSFIIRFRKSLENIRQIKVLSHTNQDPLKVTIQTRCHLSGYELQGLFEQRGIYTELADPYNILLILPLHVSEVYLEAVSDLHEVLQQYEAISELNIPPFMQTDLYSVLPFSYKRLKGYKTRIVSLDRAEGLIAGDMIVPYPPGIPLIMRGERITKEQIAQWHLLVKSGSRFQGASYIQEGNIKVYEIEGEEK